MSFLSRRGYSKKDLKCFYCFQRYPSKRDLAIHEYIHGSHVREAIFNLTIQPRNSYLVYEEFIYACGKMESGVFGKEVGCAETPEQEEIDEKSSSSVEFDTPASQPCLALDQGRISEKSSSSNAEEYDMCTTQPCSTLEEGEIDENSSSMEESDATASEPCHTTSLQEGKIDENSSSMEESDVTSSQPCNTTSLQQGYIDENSSSMEYFDATASQPCHTTSLQDFPYAHTFRTDLFPYETFHGRMMTMETDYRRMTMEDSTDMFKSMADNVHVKYETFPRRTDVKNRETWEDRCKTSLVSRKDLEGNFPIFNSGANRCGSAIRLEPDFTFDSGSRRINV